MSVVDPALPALPVLLGEDAGGVLRVAVGDLGEVRRWWRSQVRHVPGRQVVVRYGVEVRRCDGRVTVETLVAEQRDREPPAGTTVVQVPDGHLDTSADGSQHSSTVWLWRYPHDPHLPGLAAAASPRRVRELLDRLGVPPGRVRVVPVTYRASRRAVLEVTRTGDDGVSRLFLKVLRPSRTQRVAQVHRAVADAVRAPAPLAADADSGMLLLSEVPGRSLRQILVDADAAVPDPAGVVDLQRRLTLVDTGLERPPGRPFGLRRGAGTLEVLLPDRAGDIAAVVEAAQAAVDDTDPVVTIHGDLHEAQVIVGGDGVLGLVDLDGTGPGALLDDAATTLAHAHLIGRWRPAARDRSEAWAAGYLDAVGALVDPGRVRRRAAGALLGLAAGSYAAGQAGWQAEAHARLDLALALALGDVGELSVHLRPTLGPIAADLA